MPDHKIMVRSFGVDSRAGRAVPGFAAAEPEVSTRPARIVMLGDLDGRVAELKASLAGAGVRARSAGPSWRWVCENAEPFVDAMVVVSSDASIAARYCRLLAEIQARPIIVYGPADEAFRLSVLEAGADVCVCSGALRELILTIRSTWRRRLREGEDASPGRTVLEYQGWQVDLTRQRLTAPSGRSADLPRRALGILTALFAQPSRVLSAREMADAAGIESGAQGVGVYVHRVRRLLAQLDDGAPLLVNVRGKGFRLNVSG